MNGSSPYWSSMGMTTPAAYSNWGWKYGASPYGQGGGGGGSPLSYQLQSTYPQGYPQPMATMPGAGMQMDPQMYMQQYYLPSLLSGEQTRLRTYASGEELKQRTGEGERLAEKYGFAAPTEPSPSTTYRLRSELANALQNIREQSGRAGTPLSSVSARAEEDLMQQFMESLAREEQTAETQRKGLLASFLGRFG